MSTSTEVGFCPRCQATRTLRSVDSLALRRSGAGMNLLRRRQVECMSCGAFLSMVEIPMRTEAVAVRS